MRGLGGMFRRHPILLRLALVALLSELGYSMIVPTLPLYLSETLHASVKLIGVIAASFAVIETLLQGPLGAVGDRLGRKPLIVGGLALSALSPMLMSLIRDPRLFVPVRALDGGGSAAIWPAIFATVGEEVSDSDRATGMALFNVTFMIGLGLGPPLGFWIIKATHWRAAALYLASALAAAATLAAELLLPGRRLRSLHLADGAATAHLPEEIRVDEGHPLSLVAAFRAMALAVHERPPLLILYILGFGHRFAVSIVQLILVLYARRQLGLTDAQLGNLYLISALAIGALALPLARLADRMPRVRAIQIGFAIAAIGLAVLPAIRSIAGLVVLATIMGVAFVFAEPAWMALISLLAPKGRQGVVMGGNFAAQGIGAMLGPGIAGYLYGDVNPAAPFWFCSAVLGVCLVLLTLSRARLAPVPTEQPQEA